MKRWKQLLTCEILAVEIVILRHEELVEIVEVEDGGGHAECGILRDWLEDGTILLLLRRWYSEGTGIFDRFWVCKIWEVHSVC